MKGGLTITAPLRALAATIALAVAVAGLAGCSQGDRRRLADEVAQSASRAGHPLTGTLVITLRPVRILSQAALAQTRGGTLASLGMVMDVSGRRAALLRPAGPAAGAAPTTAGAQDPVLLFEHGAIFARRVTKSPADKRLWSRLEFNQMRDVSIPKFVDVLQGASPGDVIAVGPVLLTDLLAGALTGSVRQRQVDAAGNRLVTFNTSISKANRKHDLSDQDKKARKNLFRSVAVVSDVQRGEVVLRKDGSLAKATFVFSEHADNQTRLDLTAVLTIDDTAPPAAAAALLATPNLDSTVRVPDATQLKGTINDRLRPVMPGQGIPK